MSLPRKLQGLVYDWPLPSCCLCKVVLFSEYGIEARLRVCVIFLGRSM